VSPKWKLLLAFAGVYITWGSTYFAIAVAVKTMPPFLMAGTRFLVAGAILYAWSRARGAARPTRGHWRSALIIGGCLLLGGNGLVVWSEQKVPSGLTAVLISTVPLWMAGLERWFGARTRIHKSTLLGITLGFAGVCLLLAPGRWLGSAHPDVVASLVLLAASVSWAVGSLYARRAPLPPSTPLVTGMEMLAGGAMLLAAATLHGEWKALDLARISPAAWGSLLYLIIGGSLIGFSAYIYLLKSTTITRASTYAYVNPVIALFLGRCFGSETLSARTLLAATIILFSVALMIGRQEQKSRELEPA
jgi:drug/metabolite transporter (DMT)-like permease